MVVCNSVLVSFIERYIKKKIEIHNHMGQKYNKPLIKKICTPEQKAGSD
ncbi:hypothetical protein GPAL_3546 [Glaciecola pallidula DSM 14239 = ACAM 615]|uniref:Uncharacterized protein n=1 Tax=Brumicola pallidula DSM 14239 = ACAM 615 TaxID=1121922 RepID=K6ZJ90_9ALTE|nr:hypothetical protein GPAL_3546 [Glaciecola pallidula DSM 14239 = ACAM 615]